MASFDELCNYIENLDEATFTAVFDKKSTDVLTALTELSNGHAAINAYLHFILASVAADGKLSEAEFRLLKPMFDNINGGEVDYEGAKKIFAEMGLTDAENYRQIIDTMVDILGVVKDSVKDDVIMLCLMVCAVDGSVSEKEKEWIRQLSKPIELTPSEAVSTLLAKAGTFVLATTDGDQPRTRVLGFHALLDDKVYLVTGDYKDTYKQLKANPKCEVLASLGNEFLRWTGKAVFVEDERLMKIAEEEIPDIVKIFKEKNLHLVFYTLEDSTAELVGIDNTYQKIF